MHSFWDIPLSPLISQQISGMKLANLTGLLNNSNKIQIYFKYHSWVKNKLSTAGSILVYVLVFHHQNKREVTRENKKIVLVKKNCKITLKTHTSEINVIIHKWFIDFYSTKKSQHFTFINKITVFIRWEGASWSWSYGSMVVGIYNYLCNQCLWPH